MLEASAARILEELEPDALVLDVGGAGQPFVRADWVMDLRPYEGRGELGWIGGAREDERFTAATWVQQDICERRPWPFADHQFEFAVCSHTLEDVRDPVWVATELQRVARRGYIEVPAVREELTYGIQGPWVGWGHHHWLVLVDQDAIEFVFKHQLVNKAGCHLRAGSTAALGGEERVQTMWWDGSFLARERVMITIEEIEAFLRSLTGEAPQAPGRRSRVGRKLAGLRRRSAAPAGRGVR